MLIAIDKRGSINLPQALRKQLGITNGQYLDLTVEAGGAITLHPVAIYRTVRLSDGGLAKLDEARKSGVGELPEWMKTEIQDAATDPDQYVP